MYRAFGLLLPESDFTLDAAEKRLGARLPHLQVGRDGDQLVAAADDWEIRLALVSGPEVLAESQEIAEKIGGPDDEADLGACERRAEVWSDYSDPMMEHFDDYLTLIEVLKSFRGVVCVDPQEPSLI